MPETDIQKLDCGASSCVLATTVSYSATMTTTLCSPEHHGNRIPLPTVLWQPRSTTHNTVATTVCLLGIALGSHIPIPTAERPALLLTTATWQPTSASQDAIATKFHNRVPTPCFPETEGQPTRGTSRQTSPDNAHDGNLLNHCPTARRHL